MSMHISEVDQIENAEQNHAKPESRWTIKPKDHDSILRNHDPQCKYDHILR